MLTDVLLKRYPRPWIHGDRVDPELLTLLRQAALVLHEDIVPRLNNREEVYETAYKRLGREVGASHFAFGDSFEERCVRFIGENYDLWNDAHGSPDLFFKIRLSLIELLYREAEEFLRNQVGSRDLKRHFALLQKRVSPKRKTASEEALDTFVTGVNELNRRFKDAIFPFEYHNGYIQRIDDPITSMQIEKPFWLLVADPKWTNVDRDMKEAMDRRDSGKGDAGFYALKALESAIRIISDDLNLTRGGERGAAEYIDNLVSAKNGRFIEVWEAETLKLLFREVRNPQGHGQGSGTPLILSAPQSTFVIESSMAWVKSLVRRMP